MFPLTPALSLKGEGVVRAGIILWGYFIDKKIPDKYEIIGSVVAVLGAVVVFYAPR